MNKLLLLIVLITMTYSMDAIAYPLTPRTHGGYCTTNHIDFDGFRYAEKIAHCKRHVSTSRKNKICRSYGVNNRKHYKVDHIIPLSIGGDNSDDNLWCQHESIDTVRLEYALYMKLKKGKIIQQEAFDIILDAKFNLD